MTETLQERVNELELQAKITESEHSLQMDELQLQLQDLEQARTHL